MTLSIAEITLALNESGCLDLLLASDAILIWGNHDLAYLSEQPWPCYGNFGENAFRESYQAAKGRFVAAIAVDGWLCTHAGVGIKLAKHIPTEVLTGGVATVADWLNAEFARELVEPNPRVIKEELCFGYGPLFKIPVCRGGSDEFGGIYWFDADGEQSQPAPTVGRQIFGHSPIPLPKRGNYWALSSRNTGVVEKGKEWINLKAICGAWIYDTLTDEIINLNAM